MPPSKIEKPIIIIGCPRSGTSLLFRLLSDGHGLSSLHYESHAIFDLFYERKLSQAKKRYDNDTLTDEDLTDEDKTLFINFFYRHAEYSSHMTTIHSDRYKASHNLLWNSWIRVNYFYAKIVSKSLKILHRPIRLVEKTPRNCYRIAFLNKLFPDAQYIFLKRDGRQTIASLIEGWKKVTSYQRAKSTPKVTISMNIKGLSEQKWKFVLPPGWQDYIDKCVEEVTAFQWFSANQAAIDGLQKIDPYRVYSLRYEDIIDNTETTLKDLCEFIQIPYSGKIKQHGKNLPIVESEHGDLPCKDKWRKHEASIQSIYPTIAPMMQELGYSLDE